MVNYELDDDNSSDEEEEETGRTNLLGSRLSVTAPGK
jgi:hypothetical protein